MHTVWEQSAPGKSKPCHLQCSSGAAQHEKLTHKLHAVYTLQAQALKHRVSNSARVSTRVHGVQGRRTRTHSEMSSPALGPMMCTPRILSVALSDTNLTRPSVSDTDRARLLAMNENLPTCARGGPAPGCLAASGGVCKHSGCAPTCCCRQLQELARWSNCSRAILCAPNRYFLSCRKDTRVTEQPAAKTLSK
jgi:hypothetical protein